MYIKYVSKFYNGIVCKMYTFMLHTTCT